MRADYECTCSEKTTNINYLYDFEELPQLCEWVMQAFQFQNIPVSRIYATQSGTGKEDIGQFHAERPLRQPKDRFWTPCFERANG